MVRFCLTENTWCVRKDLHPLYKGVSFLCGELGKTSYEGMSSTPYFRSLNCALAIFLTCRASSTTLLSTLLSGSRIHNFSASTRSLRDSFLASIVSSEVAPPLPATLPAGSASPFIWPVFTSEVVGQWMTGVASVTTLVLSSEASSTIPVFKSVCILRVSLVVYWRSSPFVVKCCSLILIRSDLLVSKSTGRGTFLYWASASAPCMYGVAWQQHLKVAATEITGVTQHLNLSSKGSFATTFVGGNKGKAENSGGTHGK